MGGASEPLPGIGQFDREHSNALMTAMDECNDRWGRTAVVLASAGYAKSRAWSTKFDMRSPRYTTNVAELPFLVDEVSSPLRRGDRRRNGSVRTGYLAQCRDNCEVTESPKAVANAMKPNRELLNFNAPSSGCAPDMNVSGSK